MFGTINDKRKSLLYGINIVFENGILFLIRDDIKIIYSYIKFTETSKWTLIMDILNEFRKLKKIDSDNSVRLIKSKPNSFIKLSNQKNLENYKNPINLDNSNDKNLLLQICDKKKNIKNILNKKGLL